MTLYIDYPFGGLTLATDQSTVVNWHSSFPTTPANTFSERQVQARAYGTSPWTYDSGALGSGLGTHTIPASTFTPGAWEIKVTARPAKAGLTSETQTVVINYLGSSPTPTITVPAGSTITTPSNTVTWTTSPTTQDLYQVQVASDAAGTIVYYDSGTVTDSAQTLAAVPFPDNGTTRYIRVRMRRSSLYAWSAWATKSVTVTHTPPATPTVTAATVTGTALQMTLNHPVPSGGQPASAFSEVYARVVGDTSAGALVGTYGAGYTGGGAGVAFVWYGPASGKMYEFRVRDVSSDGRYAYSTWVAAAAAVAIKGVTLLDPSAASSTVKTFLYNAEGAEEEFVPESALINYDGREYPSLEYGISSTRTVQVPELVCRTLAEANDLLVFAALRKPVLYRDKRARKVYGRLTVAPFKDTFYGYVTALTVEAVDYPDDRAP